MNKTKTTPIPLPSSSEIYGKKINHDYESMKESMVKLYEEHGETSKPFLLYTILFPKQFKEHRESIEFFFWGAYKTPEKARGASDSICEKLKNLDNFLWMIINAGQTHTIQDMFGCEPTKTTYTKNNSFSPFMAHDMEMTEDEMFEEMRTHIFKEKGIAMVSKEYENVCPPEMVERIKEMNKKSKENERKVYGANSNIIKKAEQTPGFIENQLKNDKFMINVNDPVLRERIELESKGIDTHSHTSYCDPSIETPMDYPIIPYSNEK